MVVFRHSIITAILATILTGCFGSQNRTGDTDTSSCNDASCIQNLCPSYTAEVSSSSKNSVCPVVGTCSINMPLTSQLTNGIPSANIACGPTSGSMIVDAVLGNIGSKDNISGWIKQYSLITAPNTNYCSNLACQKVVSVGDEILNPAEWASGAREVFASEMKKFFSDRVVELGNAVVSSFASQAFPEDIDKCKFVTGEAAISNQHPATY
ncbi:MAG: hypothetical protein V1647_03010, partial [Pseudomonadota bacterium]